MSPVDHLPWRDDRRRTTPELRAMTAAAYQAEERFVRWFGWHVFNQSHRFEEDRPETHLYFACPLGVVSALALVVGFLGWAQAVADVEECR